MSFAHLLLTILAACAFLVQLHYLRPVFAGRRRAGLPASFRTTAWFVLTVWYSFNMLTIGFLTISTTAACGVALLAIAEITVTFNEELP